MGGSVYDTPNSFVWEIGHTSPFTSPASKFCVPGQSICQSFNNSAWAGTSPIQIKSVTFGDGSLGLVKEDNVCTPPTGGSGSGGGGFHGEHHGVHEVFRG